MFKKRLFTVAAAMTLSLSGFALPAGAAEGQEPYGTYPGGNAARPANSKAAVPPAGDSRPYLRSMDANGGAGKPNPAPPASIGAVPAANPVAKPPAGPAIRRPDTPAKSQDTVMRDAVPPPVEKGELAPVMAADGSGLPHELWRGVDLAVFEKLISELEIPPRSPALHNLWKRLITSKVAPPSGMSSDQKFAALRLEALYRSGLANEAAAEIAQQGAAADPVITALSARNELASGHADKACAIASQAAGLKGDIPKRLKGQTILMTGYCAAVAKDAASAGLAGELARDEGVETSPGLEGLDAISIGAKPKGAQPKQWTLLDYFIMQAAGAAPERDVLEKAEPALLVALASDTKALPESRLQAGEAAARLNAVSPDDLAQIYRASATAESADTLLNGANSKGAVRRAGLFKAAETEQTPMKKTRLIRALIDDAKRAGLAFQGMQMAAKAAEAINPQPEIVWFAETAAEIGLASGNTNLTKRWIALAAAAGGGINPLQHWMALADIADPGFEPHGAHLAEVEGLALHGRFTPDALHRLATVLDALQYNIPIPLWEAASRTPQPNAGHLPATGVLSELQDASKKKEFGRTVLLAMKSLGPNGAEGAHMIALGDSIRALKRAGLEADARRLGLEALLGAWPRTAVN
jgi:hypothetical protein